MLSGQLPSVQKLWVPSPALSCFALTFVLGAQLEEAEAAKARAAEAAASRKGKGGVGGGAEAAAAQRVGSACGAHGEKKRSRAASEAGDSGGGGAQRGAGGEPPRTKAKLGKAEEEPEAAGKAKEKAKRDKTGYVRRPRTPHERPPPRPFSSPPGAARKAALSHHSLAHAPAVWRPPSAGHLLRGDPPHSAGRRKELRRDRQGAAPKHQALPADASEHQSL